ncbi:hypothetical protein, unknown function [Leishmania tarentolae]|uniref:Uncharacterized protein n=1 Tax=Leishmania tarentolae TaxID=5689 RepID=A0A640KI80_LEITA|nr:hypothetical protein, unknown function [Leishmania tarentolae]
MDSSQFKHELYDLPQEQLEYFGSRTRAPSAFSTSEPAQILCDKATLSCSHEILHHSQERPDDVKEEMHAVTQVGSLAEKYHQYFAKNPQVDIQSRWINTDNTASESYPVEESQLYQTPASKASYQKPVLAVSSHASSVQRAHPPVRAKAVSQLSSHRGIPQEQPATNIDRVERNMRRPTENGLWPSKNDYEQPHGDRHVPFSKLSPSCGTPVSQDLPTEAGTSALSQGEEEALSQQAQGRPAEVYSYMPQQTAITHPALKMQGHEHTNHSARNPESKGHVDEYERIRDEEVNCTFHPKINNLSLRRKMDMQKSPDRESQPASSPHPSRDVHQQGLYEKMHGYAEAAKKRHAGRRAQKEINDAEIERNASENSRSTFMNPHRSPVDSQDDPKEVFLRLYADAQRYHKEKAEQERLIELRRRQERGEVPYDTENGSKLGDTSLSHDNEFGVSEDEKSRTAKPRGSSSPRKGSATRELFERLSRPNTVTIKFEKQKEQAEKEKREKEQRDAEAKRSEMEKIALYTWRIPSKSFTFSDLKSQNTLYIS